MDKSVVVRLAGGFGNQLFQFAAAHTLARHCNIPSQYIYLDNRFLGNYESKRAYEIFPITSLFKCVQANPQPSFLLKFASKFRLARILDLKIGPFDLINSNSHLRSSIGSSNSSFYLLDGYFQHPDFVFDEYFRSMIFKHLFDSKLILINRFKGGLPTVGIHIRRGDYVTSKSAARVFRTIPKDYYLEALHLLRPVYNVLVFSDDPEVSSEFSKSIGGVDMSRHNLTLQDEFILLSSCDDHVIANSTFSWWAAFFGHTSSGRVISPRNWFLDSKKNSSNPLLLPYFNTIDL